MFASILMAIAKAKLPGPHVEVDRIEITREARRDLRVCLAVMTATEYAPVEVEPGAEPNEKIYGVPLGRGRLAARTGMARGHQVKPSPKTAPRDVDPAKFTHVLHTADIHATDSRCWCRPRINGGLMVHRHFEG